MSTAELREAQLAVIQSEIEAAPLLSDPVEVLSETCSLVQELADNASLLPKVLSLFANAFDGYSGIRYARRDGNCFYRCAVFALLEEMLRDKRKATEFMQCATAIRAKLIEEYGDFVEDFCDPALNIVRQIETGKCTTSTELHAFSTTGDAEYMLYFYRYAVSNYIRSHRDEFLPFVMGLNYEDVDAFCRAEVDAVASECDNVQLVAFANCFQVRIIVEYLDSSNGTCPTQHSFSDNCNEPRAVLTLLYRPGHYDLLYK